ncbi:MAG: hypothetical protein K9L17_02765 [Clostridiales bacterium]|nr:hypothetical protein [Clostridiales bacterium]MCF8021602.1 hypothetical protein [Clostridiales bacterium]
MKASSNSIARSFCVKLDVLGDSIIMTGATLTSYIYYNSPAGEGNQALLASGASLVLILI